MGTGLGDGYSMEAALEEKDKLLELYPQVLIRDNATREVRMFSRKDPEKGQSVERRSCHLIDGMTLSMRQI